MTKVKRITPPVAYNHFEKSKRNSEPIPTTFNIGDQVKLSKIPLNRGDITKNSKIGMHGVIVDYGPGTYDYTVYWSPADYEGFFHVWIEENPITKTGAVKYVWHHTFYVHSDEIKLINPKKTPMRSPHQYKQYIGIEESIRLLRKYIKEEQLEFENRDDYLNIGRCLNASKALDRFESEMSLTQIMYGG